MAVAGILHPALALGARDVVRQVGIDLPDGKPDLRNVHRRVVTVVDAVTVISAVLVLAVVVVSRS